MPQTGNTKSFIWVNKSDIIGFLCWCLCNFAFCFCTLQTQFYWKSVPSSVCNLHCTKDTVCSNILNFWFTFGRIYTKIEHYVYVSELCFWDLTSSIFILYYYYSVSKLNIKYLYWYIFQSWCTELHLVSVFTCEFPPFNSSVSSVSSFL